MNAQANPSPVYCFGAFEANPRSGELRKKGLRIKLQDQPFQLLQLLLERAGEIISREEVRQRLWPENTFVDFDASLRVAVGKLRDALGDTPENPRFIETIPRRGYRFVAPVTVLGGERLESTPQAQDIPAPSRVQTNEVAVAPRPARNGLWIALLATGILTAAGIAGLQLHKRRSAVSDEAAPVAAQYPYRRSVAFLGFHNLPARTEDAWMSHAFAEMLGTELGVDGSLRVISDEDVTRARKDLSGTDHDSLALATLQQLHQRSGADLVVLGSYILMGGKSGRQVRLDIRVQDTQNGETAAEDSITDNEENLFEIVRRAGADLRTRLGMRALDPAGADLVRASLPVNSTAVRYYAEAKSKLWDFDFPGARDLLIKSIAADPDYPLAHADLSVALTDMGYQSKATGEAKVAVALSAHLPEEERLLITGQYQGLMNDWLGAGMTYRRLFNLRPDRLDYGLLLAKAQYFQNPDDSGEAMKSLNALRAMPAPAGEDPRIDLLEASVMAHTNAPKGVAAAKRALVKGSATGSKLLVARAYGVLCQLGTTSGISSEESVHDCESGVRGYAEANDKYNEARTLSDYAGLYYYFGDLQKAESMWRNAAARFRTLDEHEGAAATANNLGDVLLLTGHLDEARKMLQSAITDYEAIDDADGVTLANYDLGQLAFKQGDLRRAESSFQAARQLASSRQDRPALAFALYGLGHIALERNNVDEAKNLLMQAAKLQEEVGQMQSESETQLLQAEVSLDQGRASEAETAARKCREWFRRDQQVDDEIDATRLLARALINQKKTAQARAELQSAAKQADKSQNLWIRNGFALVEAEVEVAEGSFKAAQVSLTKLQRDSHRWGFNSLEFEVELAQARAFLNVGRKADASRILERVKVSSGDSGFERIRQEAARLSQSGA